MKKFVLLFLVSTVCLAFTIGDIGALRTTILNKLTNYSSNLYPEKIYIHTDKPYYSAGEDIWFSAYLLNGVNNTKSEKSHVIYVQLVNETDSLVSEQKLFCESVRINGDFKIPTNLKDGNYRLQAYTNYMRNQTQQFFFKKDVTIFSLNSFLETDNNDVSTESKELADLGFYPEGGYLVASLDNKIAVKIKDADLNTKPIVGIIEDGQGKKITDFKTAEFGMAAFNLKPEIGKEYRAVVAFGNENIVYPLPIPLERGYVLSTSQNETDVIVNVSTNNSDGLENTFNNRPTKRFGGFRLYL